jgi:hypothetical protein
MPASRTALLVAPFIVVGCAGLAACRVTAQQNDLRVGDDEASSAPISVESADAGDADASDAPASDADAASDAFADADVEPPCTEQTMYASAPTTSCVADSFLIAGGTIAGGGYYLSRWADGETSCSSTAQRQGTMSIEDVGGSLFMRWILSIDGKTSSGTYELAPKTATSLTRTEVCADGAPGGPTIVSYTMTSTELLFVHAGGRERWTRIPKAAPDPGIPIDPIVDSR